MKIVSVCINPVDDVYCARMGRGECRFYDPHQSRYTCVLFGTGGMYESDPDDRFTLAAARVAECLYAERVKTDEEEGV